MWEILHVSLAERWGEWRWLWRGRPSRIHWKLEKDCDREGVRHFPHEGRGSRAAYWMWKSIIVMSHWIHGKHPVNDIIRQVWIIREFKSCEGTFPHLCVWTHRHSSFKEARVLGENLSPWTTPLYKWIEKNNIKAPWRVTGKTKVWGHNVIISSTDYIKTNHWNGKKLIENCHICLL